MDTLSDDVLILIERYLGIVQLSLLDQTSKRFRVSIYQVLKERQRQFQRDLDEKLPRHRKSARKEDPDYKTLFSMCIHHVMRSFGLTRSFFSTVILEYPEWKRKQTMKLSEFNRGGLLKHKCYDNIRNMDDLKPIVTAYCQKYVPQKKLEIDM